MSVVPKPVGRLVYERAGGACEYCGVRLARRDMTVDHWVPRYRGGGDERANLRCACESCNTAKGNLRPDEWAPIAAARRAAQGGRTAPTAPRLSRLELVARCAPFWKPRTSEGSPRG